MDVHGFDDPGSDIHPMYSPDMHDTDPGSGGLEHDPQYDPAEQMDGTAGAGGRSVDREDIELNVDGHTTEVQATIDVDHDGKADTAVIRGDDGQRVVVTDSDNDGTADRAVLVDERGRVVDSAAFDESTGRWRHVDAEGSHSGAGHTSGGPGHAGTAPDADRVGPISGAPSEADEQVEVNAGGNHTRVTATVDTDRDGRPETAILDAGDGTSVAFADTDHDGRADEAALTNADGRVTEVAHIDPHTGQWVRGDDGRNPFDVGDAVPGSRGSTAALGETSSDGGTRGSDGGTRGAAGGTTDASTEPSHGATHGTSTASTGTAPSPGQPIVVDAGGRTSTMGTTVDANHDGVNETAVVRGPDGSQVAFSDSDGDGKADHATVIDATGKVVGTAQFDPATGEWSDSS